MSRLTIIIFSCLLLAVLIFGCSSDPAGPGGDPDPDPEPNPDGVLLEGDDADGAVDALVELPPSPAPDEEIVEGLFTTRLMAVLDPDATVGQVNAALDAAGARILSMRTNSIFVTLKIPAVVDAAGARDVADQLAASGAFAFVLPAWQARLTPPDVAVREMPPSGAGPVDHLTGSRFPAAWNAKGLALANDVKTIVMVPDLYKGDLPHPEISCQQFRIGGGGISGGVAHGSWVGNHGYGVSSAVGADHDADPPTGACPAPGDLLDLRSVGMGGLPLPDMLYVIYERLPWGTPFVLNTSLGNSAPNTAAQKLAVALESVYWRSLIAGGSGNFLHLAAAGNTGDQAGDDGESRFCSAFTMSHLFDDLRDAIAGAGVSEADSLWLDLVCSYYEEGNPAVASALPDVLVVGSSDNAGLESAWSCRGSEVRAGGEKVLSVCADFDPGHGGDPDLCNGAVWSPDGTSFASPVVAGLAAYMWTLDIDLPVDRMRAKLLHAYHNAQTPGLIDAYIAVLSLDETFVSLAVREAIMDVAGNDGHPGSDGVFDEKDLALYVQAFNTAAGAEDYSRYDLNGDGRTGGVTTAKFDLTADPLPHWGPGELALTDCEILEHYAYLPGFYTGDDAARDLIMVDCLPIPMADMVRFSGQLHFAATVTYHPSGATQEYENFELYIQGEGGVAGNNFNFNVDSAALADGRKVPVRGTISGTFADGGRSLSVFNADYDVQPYVGDRQSVSYTLIDVPLMGYGTEGYSWITYELIGPATCPHINALDVSAEDGNWDVTHHECTGLSGFRIDMYD